MYSDRLGWLGDRQASFTLFGGIRKPDTERYTAWHGNGNLRHSHRDLLKGFEFLLGLARPRRVAVPLPPHLQTTPRPNIEPANPLADAPLRHPPFTLHPNIHSRTHVRTPTLDARVSICLLSLSLYYSHLTFFAFNNYYVTIEAETLLYPNRSFSYVVLISYFFRAGIYNYYELRFYTWIFISTYLSVKSLFYCFFLPFKSRYGRNQ
jgi:hypothetical protein